MDPKQGREEVSGLLQKPSVGAVAVIEILLVWIYKRLRRDWGVGRKEGKGEKGKGWGFVGLEGG